MTRTRAAVAGLRQPDTMVGHLSAQPVNLQSAPATAFENHEPQVT